MLKLIIKHKGKILQETSLELNKEYLIGRGKDNQIILPEQPGISRKHLSLSVGEDDQWIVKNLSQTQELILEGEEKQEGTVPIGGSFQIRDFHFTLIDEKKSLVTTQQPEEENLATEEPPPGYKTESQIDKINNTKKELDHFPESSLSSSVPELVSGDDKTRIMNIGDDKQKLLTCLKVSYDDDTPRDIFKLEDQSEWVFGRDESADIIVDNPNISREHFKITQDKGFYYIQDLKSSNGTILNDKELSPGKTYPIQSGDVIYIMDIDIVFEIKNLSLEKKLAGLKAPPPPVPVPSATNTPFGLVPIQTPPGGAPPPVPYLPPPLPADLPGVIMETPEEAENLSVFQKNKKRLIIYGVLMIVLFFFVNKEKQKEKEPPEEMAPQAGSLAGLTPQQTQIVKDTYQVAQQLYSKGKFEYCKSEIKKVHEYTDSYQDSKKLEIACMQAAENKKRKHDLELKKQKAKETEEFIQKITSKCAKEFERFRLKYELVDCLNPAIELAPADSRIHTLTERFDAIELEKEEKKQRRAERKRFIGSIRNKYNYAKSLYKRGQVLKSMSAYQHFINISNHKELKETRETAKRELASIKKNFNDTNNRLNRKCEGQFNSQSFQKAYYTCKKASEKIPESHNKKALAFMEKARQKLEVKMRPIYEEASLNESVGNVSAAKEDWNKILSQDVDTGLYYNRAKEKLNKY
ncbi:MAG: FHA domain-containing protein [Bdellovibrionales bacterium]|nr:FHA domain-containing protein [Bdellovibrionales bacterium]